MKTYTDEENDLMNDVLEKLHEYVDEMKKAADEDGKDFRAWLFEGNWFLDFCRLYRGEEEGEINTGLELGFIINFDMWINNSLTWPVCNKKGVNLLSFGIS